MKKALTKTKRKSKKIFSSIRRLSLKIKTSIKENKLFYFYLLLAMISTFLVRVFTTQEILSYKPFITDLGTILILGCFYYLFKTNKGKYIYLLCMLSFECLVSVINHGYYLFYSSFASITEISSLGQVNTVTGSIFERLTPNLLIYLLIPFIFVFLYHRYIKKAKFDLGGIKKRLFTMTIVFGSILLVYSFAISSKKDLSRIQKQWNRSYVVNRYGVLVYQFSDIITSLNAKLNTVFGFESALLEVDEYFKNTDTSPKKNEFTGIFEGKNIIFVHMESIQAWMLDIDQNGPHFKNGYLLPTVEKLRREGAFFSNFYPEISTGTSSDTEFTLLTSLLPTRSGIVFTNYYNREYVTIPKLFNDKNYFTFSMHGNDFSMWNRNKAHPSLGYKNFYFKDKYTFDEETEAFNLGIEDWKFFEQSFDYINEMEANYYSTPSINYMGTVITLSNHSPYIYLDKYKEFDLTQTYTGINEDTGETETIEKDYLTGTTIGNYLLSSHNADVDLGEFIEMIENSNYYNDTIFVFYGDHDPRLSRSQYNYYYNYDPINDETKKEDDEGYYDYNTYEHTLNKNTPLIIWSKNKALINKIKGTYDYPMGMIDVMPTICNLFGLHNEYALGHDIFTAKYDNIVPFPNGDYITSNYLYSNANDYAYVTNAGTLIGEEEISNGIDYTEQAIQISNDIIIHNLIKYRREYNKYDK